MPRLSPEQRAEDDRLREAARAGGEKRYLSIRLCSHEEHNENGRCLRRAGRSSQDARCVWCRHASNVRYQKTDKFRASRARHEKTDKRRASNARHRKTDKRRASRARHEKTDKRRASAALRRAKRNARKRASLDRAPEAEIRQIQTHYESCAILRKHGIDVELDHIIPLSRGGVERLFNIEIKTREYNQHKRADMTEALERFEFWHDGRLLNP